MKKYTWRLVGEPEPSLEPRFNTPTDVCDWARTRPEFKELREHFMVVVLNTRNALVGFELISIGSLNTSLVHPREVFRTALRVPDCAAIVLVHNHPSGDVSPSREDLDLTKRLCEGGELLCIEVLDHIVVAPTGVTLSMKEKGLL